MRVLQLIDSLDGGGAERMAINIANEYSKLGQPSFLCTTRKEGILKSEIVSGVHYKYLRKKSVFDFRAYRILYKFIKDNKISVIHAHTTSISMAVLIKQLLSDVRIVWHDHYGLSNYLNDRPFKWIKAISSSFDGIISCNKVLRDWAKENLDCNQVVYIQNFIVNKKTGILSTDLKGKRGTRIVCLANLRRQKNHLDLIRVFHKLLITHNDWTLHLVGKDDNDQYSLQIKSIIQELELNDKVFIYGSCSDVNEILMHMDIGVLFSKSEGLPLALLEYGLSELPVIATDVGLCSEVIQDSGYIISDINKIESEGLGYLKLYCDNKELRIEKGKNLKQQVEIYYGTKGAMKKIMNFYKLIENSSNDY